MRCAFLIETVVCGGFQVCGTLSGVPEPRIGADYTVLVQRRCTSNVPCTSAPAVNITSPIVFYQSNGLVVRGQEAPTTPIVAARCPVFVFDRPTQVEVTGLEITCTSNVGGTYSSGILFHNVQAMVLDASEIIIAGAIHSALVVRGGNRALVPPVTAADLTGSAIGPVTVRACMHASAMHRFSVRGLDTCPCAVRRLSIRRTGGPLTLHWRCTTARWMCRGCRRSR